jgi:hypothetical protein
LSDLLLETVKVILVDLRACLPAANTLLPILALGALAFVSVAKTFVAGECGVTLAIVLEAAMQLVRIPMMGVLSEDEPLLESPVLVSFGAWDRQYTVRNTRSVST